MRIFVEIVQESLAVYGLCKDKHLMYEAGF